MLILYNAYKVSHIVNNYVCRPNLTSYNLAFLSGFLPYRIISRYKEAHSSQLPGTEKLVW
jgi:hypothetical protein